MSWQDGPDVEPLPCPFCGGAAELDSQQAYTPLGGGPLGKRIVVYCTQCSAEIGFCREDDSRITPAEVIGWWNERDTVSKRQLDALKGAYHALRSYQHGNAATDLALSCADALKAAFPDLKSCP